jgi:hypothetical protein
LGVKALFISLKNIVKTATKTGILVNQNSNICVFLDKKNSKTTNYEQNIDIILTNEKKYAIISLSIIY